MKKEGCYPKSIYASRIVKDEHGLKNIYASEEDYIKRYVKKLFPVHPGKKIDKCSNKAIFLDRDGTINVEKDYLYRIEDFEFLPGVIDGLRILQDAGYILIIITNQSGIARGYYKEYEFHKLNNWMKEELKHNEINISAVYYCPHHPEAKVEKYRVDCDCRKPKLGMYKKALEEFNIDLSKSYTIGDKIRDCAICADTACRGFLIANNEKEEVIQSVKNGDYERIEYAQDLKDAAERIVG